MEVAYPQKYGLKQLLTASSNTTRGEESRPGIIPPKN